MYCLWLSIRFYLHKVNGRSSHADVVLKCVFICAKFSVKKKDLRKQWRSKCFWMSRLILSGNTSVWCCGNFVSGPISLPFEPHDKILMKLDRNGRPPSATSRVNQFILCHFYRALTLICVQALHIKSLEFYTFSIFWHFDQNIIFRKLNFFPSLGKIIQMFSLVWLC